MREDHHAIVGYAGALLVAVASVTTTQPAWAQVRSSIGASARVLQAGPAWAAERGLGTLLESSVSVDGLTEPPGESVILTESEGPGGPQPRITVVVEPARSADLARWDQAVKQRPVGQRPVGQRPVGQRPVAPGRRRETREAGISGDANAVELVSRRSRRVVLLVEHVAN